ncbi:MAG: hypothetical protein AAGE92_00070 [Cyanobacteria bacterium P01_G01_bin.4]
MSTLKKLDTFLNSKGGIFLANALAQSGYGTMPDSPLGAVGRAQLATQQQVQQQENDKVRNAFLEQRLGVGNRAPAAPSAVREFQFFNGLSDEEKQAYLRVKRASQVKQIPGLGAVDLNTPGGDPRTLIDQGGIVDARANEAGAIEAARQGAITSAIPGQVQARADAQRVVEGARELEGAEAKTQQFIDDAEGFIEQLESGELRTGPLRGQLPAFSTEAQLFDAWSGEQVLDRISEATFGALSEGEREFLRRTVTNRTNTPEANIRLIERKIEILRKAEARARRRAGVEEPPAPTEIPDFASMSDDELRQFIEGP